MAVLWISIDLGSWKLRALCARPGPASLPAPSGAASTGSWLWFPPCFSNYVEWSKNSSSRGLIWEFATAVCPPQPAALSLSASPSPALCGPFTLVLWLLSPRLWDSDLTTHILLCKPQISRPEDADQAKLATGPIAVGHLSKA